MAFLYAVTVPASSPPLSIERIFGTQDFDLPLLQNVQWKPDQDVLTYIDHTGANGLPALWRFDATTKNSEQIVNAAQLPRRI